MKSHKLNIKIVIGIVGIMSLVIFSLVLIIFHIANMQSLGEILTDYGFILAPISILWVLFDKYLWHIWLVQSLRKTLNIAPDIRGRWEGSLENADGSPTQKFVIEVKQSLTLLKVHSYSTIGHSQSVLCEIATDTHEESFTLCYLWEGETNTDLKDMHQGERFQGYTMLNLYEHESPKALKGSYFTNRRSGQSRGGIILKWVSLELKRSFE